MSSRYMKRIDGWLALFFAGSCVGACLQAYALFRSGSDLHLASETRSILVVLTAATMTLIHASLFAATIIGLALFLKRDSHTPTFWATVMISSAVANVVLLELEAYEGYLMQGEGFGSGLWSLFGVSELRGSATALIWTLYWMRSVRVRATFGRNAFSKLPTSSIDSTAR